MKTWFIAVALCAIAAASAAGCGASACDEVTQKYAACSDSSDVTDGESADCNDAQELCAQCYLDTGKDLCTELLEIAAQCTEQCSVGI